jgi:hypothetical protein
MMLRGSEKTICVMVIKNSINNGTLSKSWDEIFIRGEGYNTSGVGFHNCIAFHKH